MKKTKLIIAMLIALFMIMSIIPFNAFKSFAATTVKLQLNNVIDFAGGAGNTATLKCSDDNVNTVDVTATGNTFNIERVDAVDGQGNPCTNYFLEVDLNSTVTFTLSSAEASIVIGEGRENLDGNNSYSLNASESTTVSFDFNEQPLGFDGTTIGFDGANVSNDKITFNVDGTEITATVGGQEGTYIFNDRGELEVDDGYLQNIVIGFDNNFDKSNMSVYVIDGQNNNIELEVNGDNEATFADATISGDFLHFGISSKQLQPGNQSAGENNNIYGGPHNIEFDVEFTGTHMNMWVNNKVVMSDEKQLQNTFKGTIQEAGISDSENNNTNELRFIAPFGDAPVTKFIINGVSYEKGNSSVIIKDEEWFITVPADSKYVIRGEADSSVELPRTIIWTNPNYVPKDAEDAEWIQGFSLDHGYADIVAIYDENGKLVDKKDYDGQLSNDGFGHFVIKPGSKVIFEFIPEYGYQLTDIRINEQKLGLTGLANQFEFVMPNTNIHFDAEFTKTEDIVKANSEKVASGTVSLGENTLSGGTAQLTVNDVELSSDKILGFENAAGEYTISNYLDIDLYQVFYKGKNDSDDVWSNKIDELDNEVTITIKLQEGINANDIVIVHNVHDGDKYEIIEIESYDEETNTVTFKTKSFSNYAIATKETVKKAESNKDAKETSNPQTGDMIRNTFIVLAIATTTLVVTFKYKRNRVVRKH